MFGNAKPWLDAAALTVGGALGVNLRHWVGIWLRDLPPRFPWPVFLINLAGSFAIGFIATTFPAWLPNPRVRLLVVTGFLGGFTTFSSYSLESLLLLERGERVIALLYWAGSPLTGLLAVIAGVWLGKQIAM
ncbi:MAG: fluoride efflux transporter CrcB [Planctomycetota bacterium]|nr:fluoride efflux transporter CrcB [Planctomycetota bacterium]